MIAFLKHAKFRAPVAKWRSRVSNIWRMLFARAGRYQPFEQADLALSKGDAVSFHGEAPLNTSTDKIQTRMLFTKPRPIVEHVENLVVTPSGASFVDGVLIEKYSACRPGLRMLMAPHGPVEMVPDGFFVQSEHLDTFGDWISEYLGPLALVDEIDAPIFLPTKMMDKPYVQRDVMRLGLPFSGISHPVLIKNARIVRQPKFVRNWLPKDVVALKTLLQVKAVEPRPGSLLYLSRYGEASEVATRSHPSLAIEAMVKARGGVVLRTGETSYDDYLAAACSAETVLLDHGSAGYNMVYWKPRRVMEFASDAWWLNAFLLFSHAAGVRDYTILRSDLGSPEEVAARAAAALDLPPECS